MTKREMGVYSGLEMPGKQLLGRLRRKWKENITMDLTETSCRDVNRMNLLKNVMRQAPVLGVLNLWLLLPMTMFCNLLYK
jgi:hypothetical protein